MLQGLNLSAHFCVLWSVLIFTRVKFHDVVKAGPGLVEALSEDALWLALCHGRSHHILDVVRRNQGPSFLLVNLHHLSF